MLVLAATPIGNFLDASARLREALRTADVVLAEDTRVFIKLLRRLELQIDAQLISLHDHNECGKLESVLQLLQADKSVVLVSDAGLPLINDPGYKLVQLAISNNIPLTCLPGPSAPLTALVLSGLPVHRFTFEGFLPPKSAARLTALRKLQDEERTMIFLESKHRITRCLEDMLEVFGSTRLGAICRELTKAHEEVLRGTLSELLEISKKRELKGEFCLVIGGAR
jgi:16S rRNA (cytidine1402-2'-O)-methyltransferase